MNQQANFQQDYAGAIVTRFAPSPTGLLHIGHAYSAMFAESAAREADGRFLLRIEDIDTGRCRPEFETAIFEDLKWLGLRWETPVRRQSDHMADYAGALEILQQGDLLYPCFCTRKDLRREAAASASAPHGPDGPLYPGTCRNLTQRERQNLVDSGASYALRLDMAKAVRKLDGDRSLEPLTFADQARGRVIVEPHGCGDVVLARKDIRTSYHLAVVVDDALQGVTLVTRGEDLLHATHVHRVLQSLLKFPEPTYHHHPLLRDSSGERFAKRTPGATLASLRNSGATAMDIHAMIRQG
jgi:glutamyl-Q tRNA(Asp) synthetase